MTLDTALFLVFYLLAAFAATVVVMATIRNRYGDYVADNWMTRLSVIIAMLLIFLTVPRLLSQ